MVQCYGTNIILNQSVLLGQLFEVKIRQFIRFNNIGQKNACNKHNDIEYKAFLHKIRFC